MGLLAGLAAGLTEKRSSVLGATTMRGLRKLRIICLLSRWKYWAGVVGLTTAMFTVSPSTPASSLSHICGRKGRDRSRCLHVGMENICTTNGRRDKTMKKGNKSERRDWSRQSCQRLASWPQTGSLGFSSQLLPQRCVIAIRFCCNRENSECATLIQQ